MGSVRVQWGTDEIVISGEVPVPKLLERAMKVWRILNSTEGPRVEMLPRGTEVEFDGAPYKVLHTISERLDGKIYYWVEIENEGDRITLPADTAVQLYQRQKRAAKHMKDE